MGELTLSAGSSPPPVKVAKVPTGTKPLLTVCHCLAVAARRKKLAPPR